MLLSLHGPTAMIDQSTVVRDPARFQFGANWRRFLSVLTEKRIAEAKRSMQAMLETDSLDGKSFVDAGSGSGLFSLAARMLGADVVSFDYDPDSVACTDELRRRYFSEDRRWRVEHGSILDETYVTSLGRFDVVYSWGVLHCTGDMIGALEQVDRMVAPGGRLFISIYNDQGFWSRIWTAIKKTYIKLPVFLRPPFIVIVQLPLEIRSLMSCLVRLDPARYVRYWTDYQTKRGMSCIHDIVDWVGGHPFEVARPEEIFDFYRARGYVLLRLKTCGGGHGCNEFVFLKGDGLRPSRGTVRGTRLVASSGFP